MIMRMNWHTPSRYEDWDKNIFRKNSSPLRTLHESDTSSLRNSLRKKLKRKCYERIAE